MTQQPHDRNIRSGPIRGFWPGTVVNIDDPDKEGKIRVRVDQVYGAAADSEKIEDIDLPWARPGQFLAGAGSGTPHIPPVGAGVWVGFWGGCPDDPVWFGGFYGAGEAPEEFVSSYGPSPQTWLTKTPHGHVIEMRWKEGESEVYILTRNGVKLRLIDDTALGGFKLIGTVPTGYEVSLDAQLGKAVLATPTQRVEMLEAAGAVNVQAASLLSLLTGGGLAISGPGGSPASGPVNMVLGSTLTMTVSAAIAITSAALLTLTGAGVFILTTAAAVVIGSVAGVKQAVVLAAFLAKYDLHKHSSPAGGSTGTPDIPSAPTDVSINVVVD